jgi:hypothetical protein
LIISSSVSCSFIRNNRAVSDYSSRISVLITVNGWQHNWIVQKLKKSPVARQQDNLKDIQMADKWCYVRQMISLSGFFGTTTPP